MAHKYEKVNGLGVVDSGREPRLLDSICSFDHLRSIAIASKVVKKAHCHNPKALWGCEVAILLPNVLILPRLVIEDLHIAGEIPVSVVLGELGSGKVGNVAQIKLVVSDRQEVIVDVFEDRIRQHSVRRLSVTQPSSIV